MGFELGFKNTISWKMGLGPPLHDPHSGLKFWVLHTFVYLRICFGVARSTTLKLGEDDNVTFIVRI